MSTDSTPIELEHSSHTTAGDLVTPVGLYLRLRDRFAHSFLLESSDFRAAENSMSFVCCDPIGFIKVSGSTITESFPGRGTTVKQLENLQTLPEHLDSLLGSFKVTGERSRGTPGQGLFGFFSYDSVQYFDDITFRPRNDRITDVPDVYLVLFRFVVAINHFKDELTISELRPRGTESQLKEFVHLAAGQVAADIPTYPFRKVGPEIGQFPDKEFLAFLGRCHDHIKRGDVFQIVPSRRFSQRFSGDEFTVYRSLRSINPSPYLYFFDTGNFKIFGSSPEAQLLLKRGRAAIHPIAGTYPRSGDDALDQQRAEALKLDPKENAEHAMLVDLARNDLSRSCHDVRVDVSREIQFYSHVIHLVSKVSGQLQDRQRPFRMLANSFPAGTLSGAPKYRAMQILDTHEPAARQFYGGCLGFIGFDGDAVFAIIIRSFLSYRQTLHYQSGFGFVFDSIPEQELEEADAKVGALRAALSKAESL